MQPKPFRPRSVAECLTADANLARLSSHAQLLLELQRAFVIETPLARHSRVANYKLGRLIIYAENGAVATKLKQIEPRLIAFFRRIAAEVTAIDVRVQPASWQLNANNGKLLSSPVIGSAASGNLLLLAESFGKESELARSIRGLIGADHGAIIGL